MEHRHDDWRGILLEALRLNISTTTEIWYQGILYRVYLERVKPKVVATAADTPVQFAEGTQAVCSQCQKQLVWHAGQWQHCGEIQPRHPAIPVDASPYA